MFLAQIGYTGNGMACYDIDECLNSNGGCDQNAMCQNTLGSKLCTCKTGYSGNGTYCQNINECSTDNGGCDQYANCTDTVGSRKCACRSGFAGNVLLSFTPVHSKHIIVFEIHSVQFYAAK